MLELQAAVREAIGTSARKNLPEGAIPAVVYGAKVEAQPVTINARDFDKVLREAGESTLVKLSGLSEEHEVLIQEIDYDPVKGFVRHVDFYAIERGKEIEVDVALEFVGESPAVKAGASLVKVLHEVTVKTTPGKLPSEIEVDLSVLKEVGDQVHIKDLRVEDGVALLHEDEDVVVTVQEVTEEPEEETSTDIDMDSIKVEEKGKKEEDSDSEESKE